MKSLTKGFAENPMAVILLLRRVSQFCKNYHFAFRLILGYYQK